MQVPIADKDRDKTCLTSPFGTIRFNSMPFGLKNARATFIRLMDHFYRAVFAYLDDILVLWDTFDQRLKHLDLNIDSTFPTQCPLG